MSGRQILIVDDDPAVRALLRLIAERRGFTVDVAADGIEALEKLREHQYAMAVIDLMMPRLNGYDLVQEMREHVHRPTVVVATAMMDSFVSTLDPNIVHSVIRKPFDIDVVGALMSEIVLAISDGQAAAVPEESQDEPRLERGC